MMTKPPLNLPLKGETWQTHKPEIRIMLKKVIIFLIPILFIPVLFLSAQIQSVPKQKIAVFAPLYLDSAFDKENNYRYDKSFPKFINPGIEFYEGMQLAFDSLNKEKAQLEIFIFDIRSVAKNLEQQLREMDSVGLIIAYASTQENWLLADVAKTRNIPYINSNLPNDGSITGNPYFILLNSTLKTHVEGIYRFLQKYYSINPIVLFKKKGMMENMINGYITDMGKSTSVPLKIKVVELTDSFTVNQITTHLDSNKHFVCISGTLEDNFNRRLATQLSSISPAYQTTMIGMPTLETISKDFDHAEFKGPEYIYSTPFYFPKTDKTINSINNYFSVKMYARPSDMVMRGYETAFRFSRLLLKYTSDLSSNLSSKEFKIFHEMDIQPVMNKQSNALDYYENKRLYFIKWQDGVIKSVN